MRFIRPFSFLTISLLLAVTVLAQGTTVFKPVIAFATYSYEGGKVTVERIYEVDASRNLHVTDRRPDGYHLITSLRLDESLFQEIRSMTHLKSERTSISLEPGTFFAGDYHFIRIKTGAAQEEICFIQPLVSERLHGITEKLYEIDLDKGRKPAMKRDPANCLAYAQRIGTLHPSSQLPVKTQPPPGF